MIWQRWNSTFLSLCHCVTILRPTSLHYPKFKQIAVKTFNYLFNEFLVFVHLFRGIMTEITIVTDINVLCRTCLSQKNTEELQDIIQSDINKQLCDITSIEISVGDGLPSKICGDCCIALTIATNFKDQCLKCDKQLRNALFNDQPIICDSITLLEERVKDEYRDDEPEFGTEVETIQLTIEKDSDNEAENEGVIASDTNNDLKAQDTNERKNIFENDQESSLKFPCTKCEKTFKHEGILNVHSMVKHGVKPTCVECNKQFQTMKEYRSHMKFHESFKPYSCSICGKSFTQQHSMKKHMRTHTGDRKHLCTICGKRFYEHNNLVLHTRIHTGEKPVSCETCGRRFAHSFVLRTHKRTHTGEKPYKCNVCNTSFATSSSLRVHSRTHTLERPYQCDTCPKNFTTKCALNAHYRSHTGEKRFQCSVCGKRAGRAADLRIHMRSHTGEKPYGCDKCPKRYHTSSNLAVHKRSHLGIKEHTCVTCGKAFGDARTLKTHCRIHTGEKPYNCKICGKSFTQSGQLSGHRKKHLPSIATSVSD
ncbi:unnamed protein product [Acanthoscelides obtectus]|uniref:Uncharacterized protein n=1 Tax=Acanthoscelides obtectus TaxID=200917 RepID=A0A9P0KNB5_ACAOB|nr:unnamed protein product [Acanthoscelides obtectus]CAK1626190.1 Zinc finger protein 180 [Acanthoscelides obtectus]